MKKLLLTAFVTVIIGSLSLLTMALDTNELFNGGTPYYTGQYYTGQYYTGQYYTGAIQYTVTIGAIKSEYGTVSKKSITAEKGTAVKTKLNKLTIGGNTVIATPNKANNSYNYTFEGWINNCGEIIKGDCTITAEFKREINEETPDTPITKETKLDKDSLIKIDKDTIYTVRIETSKYGTVSKSSITAEKGTEIKIVSNRLTIGGETVVALPNNASSRYEYLFDGWINNCGDTVKGNCTITANFRREINEETPDTPITKETKLDKDSLILVDKDTITKDKTIDTGSAVIVNKGADAKLTNNLTKTVEFKENETSRKVVFDGKYTAQKDTSFNSIKIDKLFEDECRYPNDDANKRDIVKFYLKINGKEKATIEVDECDKGIGVWFNEINVEKGTSVDVTIKAENVRQTGKMLDRKYKVTLRHSENFDQVIWGEASAKLVPIKIIDVKDDQETTKFGTISIANSDNPSEGITIMDRNLGATSNDITSSDSYGYYYQWGNNYGFDSNSKFKTSSDKVTWNKSYNNHGYYDNIFRTTDGDYWVDGSHDGLWGGENDSKSNNRGSEENNFYNRQGPCPDGYHVPSAGEWGLLVKYRKNTYEENVTLQGSQGQYSFSDKTATKNFSKYFKLPLAGSLSSYNGYLLSQEKEGGYWSSSINIENEGYAEHLYIDYDSLNRVYATATSPRSEGLPIRCFKNTYEPTTKNIEKIKINNEEEKKLTPQDSITIINKSSKTVYNDGKQGSYSPEMVEGYEFAYEHGITSASSIEKAKINSPLTRIEMAKMLSYYAINVLGMEPDTSKRLPRFGDVSDRLNSKYNNAITLAYQLGIMGQNIKSENYRPNDKVTRAEFATALSRLLYGTQDGTGKEKYYRPHIVKLSQEGIISKTNPKLIEKRGYVMLMLMRSVE